MSDLGERIGNGERDAAIEALKAHHAQGRLNSREYEDRSVRARQARTWSELEPLFTDLPQPRPAPGRPLPLASAGPPPMANYQHSASDQGAEVSPRGGLLPEPWAGMVMGLTPFAALILFLSTGSWLWWLAIPIVGVIAHGPDTKHRGHGHRRGRGLTS